MLNSVDLIHFSPTHTTRTILEHIAKGIDPRQATNIDLITNTKTINYSPNEFVIFGVPVYSGRVPQTATERLQQINGEKTPCAIVVVYGNRDFEDALLELKDIAIKQGFLPIVAGAFIGEHSYSTPQSPIASGRPDNEDITIAFNFGKEINKTLASINPDHYHLSVPGNHPYKVSGLRGGISPFTIQSACTLCGVCASICPTQAIKIENEVITDSTKCILCCACIKQCKEEARINTNEKILATTKRLFENFTQRKTPQIYMPENIVNR